MSSGHGSRFFRVDFLSFFFFFHGLLPLYAERVTTSSSICGLFVCHRNRGEDGTIDDLSRCTFTSFLDQGEIATILLLLLLLLH